MIFVAWWIFFLLGLQEPRYANRVAEVQKRNAEALANLQMLRERMERREAGSCPNFGKILNFCPK